MSEQSASRTLLKSPPELWAECSDPQSLTRHLDTFFGEIRITRLEPENTVAWEGERGSGTVRLEPAGWGTRVTLTAIAEAEREPATPEDPPTAPEVPPAEPALAQEEGGPAAARPTGRPATFLARLLRRFSTESDEPVPNVGAPESDSSTESDEPVPEVGVPESDSPAAESDPAPVEETSEATDALAAALESLGMAHHRPFSRS